MKINIYIKIFLIILLITLKTTVNAQKYIVFERHTGINKVEFKPGLQLSQNEVALTASDTTLSLFNWYFTPKAEFKWSSLSGNLSKIHDNIASQILITAVPLIVPKTTLVIKKLNPEDLKILEITSKEQLLEQTLKDFYVHLNQKQHLMPPLKTIAYGLIIKDKQNYYMVMQKVLVSQFILRGDQWYFPNEFKNGVLNLNPEIKTYQLDKILAIESEMKKKNLAYTYLNQIYDRIFVSSVRKSNEFNEFIFNFWEYHSDDVVSSLLNLPKLHHFNLGLGSFEFLKDVGVINCTLDSYIKNKISYNQRPFFTITAINALKLSDFQNLYKNSIPKSNKLLIKMD